MLGVCKLYGLAWYGMEWYAHHTTYIGWSLTDPQPRCWSKPRSKRGRCFLFALCWMAFMHMYTCMQAGMAIGEGAMTHDAKALLELLPRKTAIHSMVPACPPAIVGPEWSGGLTRWRTYPVRSLHKWAMHRCFHPKIVRTKGQNDLAR